MAKIMLVEDDNNLREIYGERLIAEGYEIVSAGDGEEALALAVREKPDLIISDVMMPKISGFDMLDILRQTPETKFTKVVMMTALGQTEDKERADRLGADKYLVKSQVTLEDVAHVVHELIYGPDEAPAPAFSAGPETAEQTPVVTAPVAAAPVVAAPVVAAPVVAAAAVAPTPAPVAAPVAAAAEPQATAPVAPIAPVAETATAPVPTPAPATPEPAAAPQPAPLATPVATPEPVQPPAPEPAAAPPADPIAPAVAQVDLAPAAPQPIAAPAPEPAISSPEEFSLPSLPDTPSGPVDPAVAPDMSAIQTDATVDEMAAITEEIQAFAEQAVAEVNEHQEPLVAPEANAEQMPEVSAPSAEQVAAAETAAVTPEQTNDVSVPSVDASATEPASTRKKVIVPISDPTEAPDINKLFEEEMAKEAASVPGAGQVVAKAPPEEPVQPLVQIEARDIIGVEIADEDGNPIPGTEEAEQTPSIPASSAATSPQADEMSVSDPTAEAPNQPAPTGPDSIAL